MSEIPSAPAPVPDYNTPQKTGFRIAKFLQESDGTYSSFWPLIIVFVALIILFLYDVSYLRYRKLVLTEQLSLEVSRENENKGQQGFIVSLHQDLDKLAPRHPEVAEILGEYFPPDSSPAPPAPGQAAK
jgi:hypothetical protein